MNFLTHSLPRPSRVLMAAAAALALCGTAVRSQAASTFSLVGPTTINVALGSTFSFSLLLSSTDTSLNGLDYNLQASGAGIFELTNRSLAGSVFPDPITADNEIFLLGAPLVLNPGESYDLGATGGTQAAPFSGDVVATFTVQTLPNAALGSYTLGTTGQSASDDQFNTVSLGGATLNVNIVPEPSTWALTAAGAGLLLFGLVRRNTRKA